MNLMRRKLTNRYLFALLLVGTQLITSYLVFTFYFKTIETDGYLINISGRQRMLSQRIALLSSERSRVLIPANRQRIQKELNLAIEVMEKIHSKIVQGDSLSPLHREIYFGTKYALDKTVREFISAFKEGAQGNKDASRTFTEARLNFLLIGLDQAVVAFEVENNKHNRTLFYIQTSILIVGILTLIFSGVFIFRPMTSEIVEKTQSLMKERSHTNFLLEFAVMTNQSKTLEEAVGISLDVVPKNWSIMALWRIENCRVYSSAFILSCQPILGGQPYGKFFHLQSLPCQEFS